MPNYCNNNIRITADKKTVAKIAQSLKSNSDDGFLNLIHPMPQELKDTVAGSDNAKPEFQKKQSEQLIEKYGADNWYDWRIANWGTKWEVNECYGDPFISDGVVAGHRCLPKFPVHPSGGQPVRYLL
jgi:hypothetical protein